MTPVELRPTFADWLRSRANAVPHRTALVAGGKTWTFAELDGDVTRTARKLFELGVKAGDRIATLLFNGPYAAILPHAALRLRATVVPLNVRLTAAEIAWQIGDASPRIVVAESRTLDGLAETRHAHPDLSVVNIDAEGPETLGSPPLDARDESDFEPDLEHDSNAVLAIIYTSGTTGQPKGAMLTVSNFWWSAIGSALNLGTHTDDRWLACLPLFHVGGLSIVMRAAIYGIAAEVHDTFDAERVNSAIDNDGVTIVSVVAVMLQHMLDAHGDRPYPASLRCVLLGGGPASRSLLERCAKIGVPVVQTYGLTETCSQCATLSPQDATGKPGSSGKALYPNELCIVRDASRDAVSGEEGEIIVRGPVVMSGYAGKPEETARAIKDGWLHTGDIGRIDEEGFLYVLDRRDDLIITGGENVYPAEVESVLASHPSVAEAAVIGADDPEWGQRVVAVVRLEDASVAAKDNGPALLNYCRERLAGYKLPAEFRFVTEPLPRTASGKLRRTALREIAATR